MLLAGYMSWTMPFAFAIAALATGRSTPSGSRPTRRYALVAWVHPRHRQSARRLVGLPRPWLGRLLGLGPGRERRDHALAHRDRLPALGR